MIVLSVCCHLLVLSGAVFLPGLSFHRARIPSAVEVDLVNVPPAGSAHKTPMSVPKNEIPPPPEPPKEDRSAQNPPTAAPKAPAEAVALEAPRPLQVKRSLKKKTYNASRVINKAIADIERQAPRSRPQSVLNAIDALRKNTGATSGETGGSAVAGIGEGTKKTLELLDIYHAEIWDLIRRNWAYSPALDQGPKNPEAVIIVKIMRNGEIRDMWFEERSGSRYFDDSCLKAVKKSNPLPPLPDGFLKPFHEVGFRFTPSELRERH